MEKSSIDCGGKLCSSWVEEKANPLKEFDSCLLAAEDIFRYSLPARMLKNHYSPRFRASFQWCSLKLAPKCAACQGASNGLSHLEHDWNEGWFREPRLFVNCDIFWHFFRIRPFSNYFSNQCSIKMSTTTPPFQKARIGAVSGNIEESSVRSTGVTPRPHAWKTLQPSFEGLLSIMILKNSIEICGMSRCFEWA